jgi:hypothetical protein
MTECSWGNKGRVALLASVAANIFLAAFVLGHLSGESYAPPLPPEMDRGVMHRGFPPHMGPKDLFRPGEVSADETRMREDFEKMQSLRTAFAEKLQAGPVSKENALRHFDEIDQVMGGVKKDAQERFASKIASMSEEERKQLAERLRERGPLGGGRFGHGMRRWWGR